MLPSPLAGEGKKIEFIGIKMDILKRLRAVFFVLALVLIALPVADHFGYSPERIFYLLFPSYKPEEGDISSVGEEAEQVFQITAQPAPAKKPKAPHSAGLNDINEQEKQNEEAMAASEVRALGGVVECLEKTVSGPGVCPVRPEPSPAASAPEVPAAPVRKTPKWMAPPLGFNTGSNDSFLFYREIKPITDKVHALFRKINGMLAMDLVPFTSLKTPPKSLVMLFNNHESYMEYTKRPAWSGAACDVGRDTLYVLEGAGVYPLSIHEMTHLYFDGFFYPARMPLWVSEGMATYMQIKASGATPEWVNAAMRKIMAGGSMDMRTFAELKTTAAMPAEMVELWYTQAYGITDYLLNKRTRDEYYTFTINMAGGAEPESAMYKAYGLPFTKFETLRNVWLHDIGAVMPRV